jgi:probable rRNA maturation factor
MTRATKKPSRTIVNVVLLDPAWTKVLPGVERLVRKAARAAAGNRKQSLTIALADDRRLRALNARDRKKDKPTNVLSYPSGERGFLGDVVLARQTVWREARQQRKTTSAHVSHLVVHGTLHLLGHDHETGEADAERMEALERRILKRLGIADPYQGEDAPAA